MPQNYSTNTPIFRRGIRCFGNHMDKYILLFIHDLETWTKGQLIEFLLLHLPNYHSLVQSIDRYFNSTHGSYFIIRIGIIDNLSTLDHILPIIRCLNIQSSVKWVRYDGTSKRKKFKHPRISTTPMSNDLFSCFLDSNSTFFNLCTCWNTNGWNLEKRDSVLYLTSIFKPACICLQETGTSKLLSQSISTPGFIKNYITVHQRANHNINGMRGLYIGVHSSCSFAPEPLIYNYILSVNLNSFWGKKCSVGNIYFPQKRWKEARITAFDELDRWLKHHSKDPAILVGDFNMPFNVLNKFISDNHSNWYIANISGNTPTYSKGSRSSCIDHIVFNRALAEYFNKSSICDSFFGISDHKPIIVSCKKDPTDVFVPLHKKTYRWSRHICNTKSHDIISDNSFSILAEDLESNVDEVSADDMVSKFINTSLEVGKNVKAIIPANLKGPAFHCPSYIKRTAEMKHFYYKSIKPLFNCSDIDSYLDQFNKFNEFCKKLKRIKSKFRAARYKANIISTGKHFVNKDYRRGWQNLKKLAKSSYSRAPSLIIKSKFGKDIVSPKEQLSRWAEHYKDLASDVTGHSLSESYWNLTLRNYDFKEDTWDINDPILLSEIRKSVLEMKKNKAPGPDGIPIEYYKAFFCDPNLEEKHTDPAKCLEIIFNKIWNGSFPTQWNSATIVSIPKKGDLTDCNNYRGISLINVWLKIISKIVTDRITNYALSHNFIRPEQFGFRNHEECISLFITIREICQRRSFAGKFTYVAFLDIKKAYDSVPIFNILTKLFRLGIRGKCFDFLSNLYKSSKARARFLDMLSDEFPINRGVRQGCPLSPILFNLFINDILNNCEKYGVQIGNNYCCGGLFADDIVLIAPSEKKLKIILNRISKWASINEMTFGVQKCATMVVKPNRFTIPPNYREPLFYINMNPIPQVSCYTYLGIPFSNDLSLDLIIEKMYVSTRNSLYSLNRFFWNRNIPLIFKKQVLQSFVISKALYYAPLLGSNQKNTKKIQTLINTGMLWCIDSFNKKKTIS